MHALCSSHATRLFTLAAIVLLGLFLRVHLLYTSVVDQPVRGDAVSYFFYAVNLESEGVYARSKPVAFGGRPAQPDAASTPGYPLFVAALLGDDWKQGTMDGVASSLVPVLIAQALLSVLVILLVYGIARRPLGEGAALTAAFLTAISPHLVNINLYLLTESLFTLLFWASLWLLARGLAPEARRAGLTAALVLGAAALTRPTVQYLPFLLALFFILRTPSSWRQWSGFVLLFLLVLSAWGLRNLASVGTFSDPLALKATIQHGSYPGLMYNGMPESRGIPYRFDPAMNLSTPLRDTLAIILQRVQAAPGDYLWWYSLGKPLALFQWETIPIGTSDMRLTTSGDIFIYPTPVSPYGQHPLFVATYFLSYLLYRPLLLLAGVAALAAWVPACRTFWGDSLWLLRLLSLILAYVIGIHLIGAPFPRYAIPFLPLVYLLAAGLVAAAWRWRQARAAIERGEPVL